MAQASSSLWDKEVLTSSESRHLSPGLPPCPASGKQLTLLLRNSQGEGKHPWFRNSSTYPVEGERGGHWMLRHWAGLLAPESFPDSSIAKALRLPGWPLGEEQKEDSLGNYLFLESTMG